MPLILCHALPSVRLLQHDLPQQGATATGGRQQQQAQPRSLQEQQQQQQGEYQQSAEAGGSVGPAPTQTPAPHTSKAPAVPYSHLLRAPRSAAQPAGRKPQAAPKQQKQQLKKKRKGVSGVKEQGHASAGTR